MLPEAWWGKLTHDWKVGPLRVHRVAATKAMPYLSIFTRGNNASNTSDYAAALKNDENCVGKPNQKSQPCKSHFPGGESPRNESTAYAAPQGHTYHGAA